jgi:methionine-rich copper-binding protein CopC
MRFRFLAACSAATALALAASAFAHAEYKSSVPEKDATVNPAPAAVVIEFDEEVNPKLSLIVVKDAAGQKVDKGDSHLVNDEKHLGVDLGALKAGIYKVLWTSVATDDGHKLTGTFGFTVAP